MLPILSTRPWLRWSAFAAVAAAFLAGGLYFGSGMQGNRDGEARGRDAAALFGVALPDTSGREQPLSQWKGKVLVVNFWATWCTPCRDEMPEFVKAQTELGGRGLQFVGIAIDQADKVQAFATELGLNYPALIGGFGAVELSKTMGNRLGALPFTIIVDRSGHIAHTQLGPLRADQLRSIVGQLL